MKKLSLEDENSFVVAALYNISLSSSTFGSCLVLFCEIVLLAKLRKILILVRKKNTTNWLIQNNKNYKIIFLNY